MTINANTKIASILKSRPDALEAIISISPRFEKLRNPVLRKLMAGRTSIAMATRLGGCQLKDFFTKLAPLGFEIDTETKSIIDEKVPVPNFITNLRKEQLITLDVRPVISSGKDPLNIILEKVKAIQAGQVLKIINSFEPTPLILMLQKKGFETYADNINEGLVETYFFKPVNSEVETPVEIVKPKTGWDEVLKNFENKLVEVDVRNLEMPLPMMTILEALENLPCDNALFVYHKRIPVFLLPELADKGFEYRINELSNGEVHLLIFKDKDVPIS